MHFGQNAKKLTINGGEFKEIGGNYTVVNQRGPETDSRNSHNKKVIDPYTDKIKRFDGQTTWQTPRASESYHPPDNHGKYYASTDSDNRGDYTQPPPHSHSHFIPRQGSFAGGHVADPNSLNMRKAHNNDTFHNDPWAYQYVDRMPPPNQRRHDRLQEREIYEENPIQDTEEDEDRQSTGGSFGNGQITVPVQRPSQTKSRPHMRAGVHPGPSTTVNSRPVQHVNDKTFRKQTQSFSDQHDIPKVPENVPDENYEFDDGSFSSSPISGDESHPQISTHPASLRGQIKPVPSQINHPMRHSISSPPNLSHQNNSNHIYSNPINNYKSDDADYSSSHGIEAQDSMSNRMANMSIRDPVPLPRSRNEPHSQILAPPMARGMSAPAQIQNTPLAYHPMGYSNPPNSSSYKNPDHNSYSNPMNNYKSDHPPSPDIEAQDFTCTRPGPSIYDSMSQPRIPRSRDKVHSHHSPTHPTPSPAMTWAGGKSYSPPSKPNAPQAYYPTGHLNPSNSMSYNNPLPRPSYSDTS